MLVLTRRSNQSIMIGDDVEVKILGVSGEKVRVGISAPAETPVYREEVLDRIESQGSAAGTGSAPAANGDRAHPASITGSTPSHT